MLVIAALNLGLLTMVFLIIGLIKPKWPLFWMEKPDRFIILVISTVMIMVSFTMYGEGMKRKSTPSVWVSLPPKSATPAPAPAAPLPNVPVPEIKEDTKTPVAKTVAPTAPTTNAAPATNSTPSTTPVPSATPPAPSK